MKTKLFLVVILISLTTIAQTDTKTYHDQMKVLMSQLDSTRFKNNTLYDRVYPLANLKEFNQNGRKDTSNYQHFYQALSELHFAGNKQIIASADQLRQKTASAKLNKEVLVGIINMDISYIKEDAFDENDRKMYIDSTGQDKKILEISGKEPYQNLQTLVISPLQYKTKQETGNAVTFNFIRGMIQKSTNPIKTLSVDFGDGQMQPIIVNRGFTHTKLSHTFPVEGNYTLKFSGSYQDGSGFETFAMINIAIITPVNNIQHIRATESFTPYVPDLEVQVDGFSTNYTHPDTGEFISEMPRIDYKYYLGSNHNELTKPIIITDGIDYAGNDENTITEIYNDGLKIKGPGAYSGEYLGTKLRALGYDVIIVDFPTYEIGWHYEIIERKWDEYGNPIAWYTIDIPVARKGGADYIQRNAQVLKELIRHVNEELVTNGSTEELVVVGPSMGALVTRWALKEMEDAGEDHNTRLWVSFDGPHQGANGATSVQFVASHVGLVSELDKLNRSASKEMLVHHYLDESNNTINAGAPNFRDRFQGELNSFGYPNPNNDPSGLRKIALVNGSSTGELNYSAGGEIAHSHFWMNTFPWSDIVDAKAFFTKDSGTKKVVDIDWGWIIESIGLEDVSKYTQTDQSIGSYDNAPGCKFPVILEPFNESFNFGISLQIGNFGIPLVDIEGYVDVHVSTFTFMPTKSTLDFQGSNTKLRDPICYDLVAAGETPFDGYYAPSENQPHVQLNKANVAWILKEINGDEPPPVYGCCGMTEIIGDNTICTNETKTYHLSSTCAGGVTWSKSGNLSIESSTEFEVEVTSNGNNGGLAWIKATFDSGNSISKNLIGNPYYELHDNGEIMEIIKVENGIPLSQQDITDIVWVADTGYIDEDPYPDNYNVSYYGQLSGHVDVYNSCGKTTLNFNVAGNNQNNCENPDYIIESLGQNKYKLVDSCDPDNIQYVDSSELYNQYGVKIEDLNPQQDEVDMNNTSNSGDIRIIKFTKNGYVITKMIIAD